MTSETETAFVHGMADVEPGVRLHYVTAGEGGCGRSLIFDVTAAGRHTKVRRQT
jgi:hypothetical protein